MNPRHNFKTSQKKCKFNGIHRLLHSSSSGREALFMTRDTPKRKVFNTCFQISILTESKQPVGGHGMTKLKTLDKSVWKRYEPTPTEESCNVFQGRCSFPRRRSLLISL